MRGFLKMGKMVLFRAFRTGAEAGFWGNEPEKGDECSKDQGLGGRAGHSVKDQITYEKSAKARRKNSTCARIT